jgi:hypothetical protein
MEEMESEIDTFVTLVYIVDSRTYSILYVGSKFLLSCQYYWKLYLYLVFWRLVLQQAAGQPSLLHIESGGSSNWTNWLFLF